MVNILTQAIQKMIWNYPTIHSSRAHCLHHLFCVNGNGLEWADGALPIEQELRVDDSNLYKDEEKEIEKMLSEFPQEYWNKEGVLELKARRIILVRRHNNKIKFCRDNSEHLALIDEPLGGIYPLCEFSKMSTVPDNIHPDYLNGVKEMIRIVFNTPINPHSGYLERDRKFNIDFSSNILTQLVHRFGKKYPQEPTSYQEWEEGIRRMDAEILAQNLAEIELEQTLH